MKHPALVRILSTAVAPMLLASVAAAHGPTVHLSYAAASPEVLTIAAGQTVHFQNRNAGGGACTVLGRDGSFESPTLARREDWHHTFERAGEFPYALKEMPSVRGTIVVVDE